MVAASWPQKFAELSKFCEDGELEAVNDGDSVSSTPVRSALMRPALRTSLTFREICRDGQRPAVDDEGLISARP